nr:unnamed protein product [Callosobruchus chinensis]
METSLNDGVYDNGGNAVQNVPHQPLLMDTNEMYTNNVMQYQTTDSSNSVYDIKETMMKTSEAELTQTTQQYYYSQTDQQNNQGSYVDYVLQQQTEATYIQQQTVGTELPQEQFLQISNIQNEQVVTERPEENSMQYADTAESSFGSQYEAEKNQDVPSETVQVGSDPMPPEQVHDDTIQEETLETYTTVEEIPMENDAPVVEHVVEEACQPEQATDEQGTGEPSTEDSHQSTEPSEELKEESSTVEPQTECTEPMTLEGSEDSVLKNGVVSEAATNEKQELEESQQLVQENVDSADKDDAAVENVTEESVTQQEAHQFVQETEHVGMVEEVVDDPAPVETLGDPLQVQETTIQETEDVSQQDDQSAYMSEIREEANSRLSVTSSQGSRRSSRRPYQDIPLHVVGHNLKKPGENQLNGKPTPKPRLGVKVPYWNLSSQMLSKAEIEKEILERSKVKQDQASSVSFARSLTQRLFKKIADNDDAKSGEDDNVAKTDKGQNEKSSIDAPSESTKIKNDSDLLAILEGDDDAEVPVMTKKTASPPQIDEANIKALEREIALQQLEELPLQKESRRAPKRSRATTSTPNILSKTNASPTSSNVLEAKSSTGKENSISPAKQSSLSTEASHKKNAVIDVEPQVRANMVLKTYSRKRKVDETTDANIKQDLLQAVEDSQVKKEDVVTPTQGVYVTKSSRVIKKKIIWDPDEVSSRSPKPSKAAETVPPIIPKSVTEKPAEKKPSPDKQAKKAVVVKKDKPSATDTKTATTDKKLATAEKKSVVTEKKSIRTN